MTIEEAIYILRNTAFLAPSLAPIDEAIEMACEALRQTEPKRGEWKLTDFDDEQTYECSICGEIWTFLIGTPADNGAKYCPNCGARMGEEREGE